MRKRLNILVLMFLFFMWHIALAVETPFYNSGQNKTGQDKSGSSKKAKFQQSETVDKKPEAIPPPMPLTKMPEPVSAGKENFPQIKGVVNGKIIVINSLGKRLSVNNGDEVDGCIVEYPELICDAHKKVLKEKQKKQQKELEQKNIKIEQEKKELEAKIKDFENTIKNLQRQLKEKEKAIQQLDSSHNKTLQQIEEERRENYSIFTEKDETIKRLREELQKYKSMAVQVESLTMENEKLREEIKKKNTELIVYKDRVQAVNENLKNHCSVVNVEGIGKVFYCSNDKLIYIVTGENQHEHVENKLRFEKKTPIFTAEKADGLSVFVIKKAGK